MIKKVAGLLILFCLSVCYVDVWAQQKRISMQNISEIKVDELSDDQIREFLVEFKKSGYSINQLEQVATQRKMPAAEIQKLKLRIENLDQKGPAHLENYDRNYEDGVKNEEDGNEEDEPIEKKIFGAELFNNKNLTFEPNLKIATPANYQLGPDDELIIDIYGYSEATYKLKISPDGFIRIPLLGPVQVSGNTIEQARQKIQARLATIYSGIATGQTFVSITLGNIRSIKVSILGEVNKPGSYTLPSLATAFNALYVSGGPNSNGSFRAIKIIRAGKVIATVDVYEFLLKGETKGNIRLNDQDVIRVGPYETRVELKGEVKRPSYYEVAKNETLKDVINFAGGFTDEAYKERIKVTRNTAKEKSVADVPDEMFGMFTPQTGDVFEIGKIIERYANRIQINGAVFRPGAYALEEGMTVSKLISKADGIKEDAFTSRAIIYRLKEDNSSEIIAFNVADVLSGKNDIALKREDVVEINSKLDLKEEYVISIRGAVLRPGDYRFAENARVEDLIVAAGGLKENASRKKMEIARRYKGEGDKVGSESAKIITIDVNEDLTNQSDVFLMPYDIVTVYTIPGYTSQKIINIEGEVQFPGQYSIATKTDRISDIIKRSGGITQYGFVEGAILIRTKKLNEADKLIRQQKIDALLKQTKDTNNIEEKINKEVGNLTSTVGIDLEKILRKPGSKHDLLLEDGDLISIPSQRQTVKISGEVLYPVRIPYRKMKRFKGYINGAGGYTQRALKRGGYVVFANGSAEATRKFLLFNVHPKIRPGAEIIIPAKEEKKGVSTVEIVSIATSITTIAILIVTLFK